MIGEAAIESQQVAALAAHLADEKKGEDIVLRCVSVERVLYRVEATALGAFSLVTDVDLARRILTDDDNREPGLQAVLFEQVRRLGRDLLR